MGDEMSPELARQTSTCRALFQAFADEYPKAMTNGRRADWAAAVKACVDFLIAHDYQQPEPSGKGK